MTASNDIRQTSDSQLSGLRDKTTIIENSHLLDIANIEDAILIVYAVWSKQAVINCKKVIRCLYDQNYSSEIIVIDSECMQPDFQIKIFGQVCEGWGEIFIIRRGKIIKKHLGKDCFTNFKVENDK
jgi:hypothetical protein